MNSTSPKKIDVTIVGGGFAGLAAALKLHQRGKTIQIVEKRPFFGGRAYSFQEPKTGQVVDNGQHLMMGAYHETFEFLKNLGTLDLVEFQRGLTVSFAKTAQEFFTLKCPNLPAPWHLAWGMLRFRGLSFRDKKKMYSLMRLCKRHSQNGFDQMSVLELLKRTGQSSQSISHFWEPLGLATINEPLHLANAQLFIEVLRQGLLSKKRDSDLVIPKVGFSELYAKPAQDYFAKAGVPLYFQTQVEAIEKTPEGWDLRLSAGKKLQSQKIILAVTPVALQKILWNSESSHRDALPHLDKFKASPIVSVNLWYENFEPTHSFVGLIDSPIHWIFNKAKVFHGARGHYLSLVVSGAYELADYDKARLVDLATQELHKIYPELKNRRLIQSQIIKEQEATFSGQVGINAFRPGQQTSLPGLYLAGDWTDTGLPATIESAVKSGHFAAQRILESSS